MDGDLLRVSLSEVLVRRKLEGGEFAYVFLPSGKEIAGKKLAFMLLKNAADLFEDIKESNKNEEETDQEFESRAMKLLPNLPFEEDVSVKTPAVTSSPTKKNTPKPTPKPTPTKKKQAAAKKPEAKKDYDQLTKSGLALLVARRRLDGGEFTYVYLPLEKAVAGKKALYCFMKNQQQEFNRLVSKGKDPSETSEEFDARVMKLLQSVPYESEVKVAEEIMETDIAPTNGQQPGCKRKSENKAVKPKKPKLDLTGSTRTVYVDLEVFKTKEIPFQISQLGAIEDKPNNPKKFFRAMLAPRFSTLADGVLDKMNIKRSQKGLMFKKYRGETPCLQEMKALRHFLSYLEQSKNNFKNLTIVTYRNEGQAQLIAAMKTNGLIERFTKLVTSLATCEEVFEDKDLSGFHPLKTVNQLYTKTVGGQAQKVISCEDIAEMLLKSCTKLEAENNFSMVECSQGSSYVAKLSTKTKPAQKMADQTYSVINSNSFLKNEKFKLEEVEAQAEQNSASTSKVGSKPPPKPQHVESYTKILPKKFAKKVEEVMEVEEDEDNTNFATVGSEVLYPVLCQPILVKLGNVDENTRFVKFNLGREHRDRAESKGWELLPSSAKVFWRQEKPFAFCHLCPSGNSDNRYKAEKVRSLDSFGAGTVLGTFRTLNKTDEEQRNLSTKVSVDLVVVKATDSDAAKTTVGKAQTTVLVKLMLKQGSLTSGNVKEFVVRPSDVLIVVKSNVDGLEFVNNLVSVDKKQAVVNRAKVVVSSAGGGKLLKEGQIIGTAILFQNDVKLLFSKMAELGELSLGVEAVPVSNAAISQVALKMKRPLVTVGNSRLYAQGSNPLLVKLDQYQATKVASKFNKAAIKFSEEFTEVIDKNKNVLKIQKLKKEDTIVKVTWKGNIPYAFVNIKIASNHVKQSIDFCDIVANYGLGHYAPLEYCKEPEEAQKINMSICVDFTEKNTVVQNHPRLVKVYLKFKDAEVDKQKVLEECFAIQKIWHSKIEILSIVFKPDGNVKLAPQKTSTNDMKAVLVVKAKEGEENPVSLTPREVLAECSSFSSQDNLKQFSVCGRKVAVAMPQTPVMFEEEPSMHYEPQRQPQRQRMNPAMDPHNPFMSDMDYMDYGDPMDMEMRNFAARNGAGFQQQPRSLPRQGAEMGFFPRGGMGSPGRGGVHSRLGAKSAPRGGGGVHSRMGSAGPVPHPMFEGGFASAPNPMYEDKFQQKSNGGGRNSLFEKARSKLNAKVDQPDV